GADVNRPATYGIRRTPLQLAIENGSQDIVQYLLDRGADINAFPAFTTGATALQLATIKGYTGFGELLLTCGADVNAARARRKGRTTFEGAAEHGRLDMLLLLQRWDVDIVSDGGEQYRNAVQFAKKNRQLAAARLVEMLYQAALNKSLRLSMVVKHHRGDHK
ncbi:ankyrin, partial [Lentithecium fluviatile CBS 122367]